MSKVTEMHFTYEPISLTRLLLQMYAERFLEKQKEVKAEIFAVYEFLRIVTDKEMESLLLEFATKENLEVITFEEWEKDCKSIFDCIFNTQKYKGLVFSYKKKGYSRTGLGVVDNSDNTFYECTLAGHWSTIQNILKEKYPHLYEAFEEMVYGFEEIECFKGVSRKELDDFIMKNFQLIGGLKNLESYLD